jgi:hypothetical protein
MTQTDQVNSGERYDPLLLLNPLQISVEMKWRRRVKEGVLSLETTETWIVYVSHSEGEWARPTISVPLNRVW